MQVHSKTVQKDSATDTRFQTKSASATERSGATSPPRPGLGGCLMINADDWGRDARTTDRTLDCFQHGGLSSASGMVFMEDSERAANISNEHGLDIGLHLNLSSPFSTGISSTLEMHHQKVRKYLCSRRFARLLYHPGLANSFEYSVAAQIDEFSRVYGRAPDRIDGHHHMHLSANVLLQGLLPFGTIVRRHFSYEPGEKVVRNSLFRLFSRALLRSRYRTTEFFFSLPPLEPTVRLQRIFNLARRFVVEVETHPINPDEYQFLIDGFQHWRTDCPPALTFGKAIALQPSPDRFETQ